MPLKNGVLTMRERAFAREFAATNDLSYASHKAGFRAASGGSNALKRPSVRERIAEIREAQVPDLVVLAIDTLMAVMRDPNAPASSKVNAADKGLKTAQMYAEGQDQEKPTEELSAHDILARVDRTLVDLIEHRPGEFAPALKGGVFD